MSTFERYSGSFLIHIDIGSTTEPENQTQVAGEESDIPPAQRSPYRVSDLRVAYDDVLPPSYFSLAHQPPPQYTEVRVTEVLAS